MSHVRVGQPLLRYISYTRIIISKLSQNGEYVHYGSDPTNWTDPGTQSDLLPGGFFRYLIRDLRNLNNVISCFLLIPTITLVPTVNLLKFYPSNRT